MTKPEFDDCVIYHYCDANALLSILTNNKLWYTHAAYLNDTMEITHGVDVCRGVIDERLIASPNDPVLISIKSYLQNAEKWQYYICCFCKAKDKLSQWRAYANDGDGFAIGFRVSGLSKEHDGPFEASLAPVRYDNASLRLKAEELISKHATREHHFSDGTHDDAKKFSYENTGAHVGNLLIDESVFLKDAGFVEEDEWRSVRSYKLEDTDTEKALIAEERPGDFVRVFQELQRDLVKQRLVRAGRYGLTPYIEVSFNPKSIHEIVCGPRTAKGTTEASLEILKKKHEISFDISRSSATYR